MSGAWFAHLLETRAAALAMDSAEDRARMVALHADEFPRAAIEDAVLMLLSIMRMRGEIVSTVDVKATARSITAAVVVVALYDNSHSEGT